jgi:hypothetical protein
MAAGLTIGEIKAKVRGEVDEAGDVSFAIAVDVTNNTGDHVDVAVDVQAVDQDGFELKDMTLYGSLGPQETKRLTDQRYMPHRDYLAIARWQVENADIT